MVGRGKLTESAWARIEPLLPWSGRRGGQGRDPRAVINGILWKRRTGAPWRDLPERSGPWQTGAEACTAGDGTAPGIACWRTQVQTKSDAVGEVVWEVSIDSSTARTHQHTSGARRQPSRADEKKDGAPS
jgi:transposase